MAGVLARSRALDGVRLTRSDWTFLAVAFAISRVAFVGIGLLGAALFPNVGPHQALAVQPIGAPGGGDWTRLFAHFDSGWYLGISHAYLTPAGGRADWLAEWAFFPLYPLLLHPLSVILSAAHVALNTDILAGVCVSNAALFAGMVYLYRLAMAETARGQIARRTVLYLLVFPGGIFFAMVYPESVFLLACVAAFYHARRRQWTVAGGFAAAALLARPQGLFLLAPLALEFAAYWSDEGKRTAGRLLHGAGLLLPLGALAGYAIYSQRQTGYWLAFSVSASQAWGHRLTPPIYPIVHFLLAPTFSGFLAYDFEPVNVVIAVAFLGLVVVAWKRLPPVYALWLLIAVLFPLSTNGHYLFSYARYVATAFPAFLALAMWSSDGSPRTRSAESVSQRGIRGIFASSVTRHAVLLATLAPLTMLYIILAVNNFPAAI